MTATLAEPSSLAGLREVALLRGLADEVLLDVARACRLQRVRAEQTVMSHGDATRDCCFVLAGCLRVVAWSPGGREVSFREAGAGQLIGEMAAVDGGPRSATVVALQDSLLARLPAAELNTLLRRHWPICERLLQHQSQAMRALTTRVYELSTLSVQQRLAAELLRMLPAASNAGREGASAPVVLPPLPKYRDLSTRIGTSREQVTRELAELVRRGCLARAPGDRWVIPDIGRLAARIEAEA